MDYAEVGKVLEHLGLRWGEVCAGVGGAEFEGAEHEEEGEDVYFVHVELNDRQRGRVRICWKTYSFGIMQI